MAKKADLGKDCGSENREPAPDPNLRKAVALPWTGGPFLGFKKGEEVTLAIRGLPDQVIPVFVAEAAVHNWAVARRSESRFLPDEQQGVVFQVAPGTPGVITRLKKFEIDSKSWTEAARIRFRDGSKRAGWVLIAMIFNPRLEKLVEEWSLKRRIKQEQFQRTVQEALLDLMAASDFLKRKVENIRSERGITAAQYNVLRILRGVYPDGHPRCEIASRMIERSPDINRLVDRLEAQGLVECDRSTKDRRLSLTTITAKGFELLDKIDLEIERMNRVLGKRLSRRDCAELTRICENIYAEDE
jgi:DNA-binding MarR family transcriptional regulator